jgi:hypothetical protein
VNGRHHAHVHRRVRANDRAGAGADAHVPGCVHPRCNTASCFW